MAASYSLKLKVISPLIQDRDGLIALGWEKNAHLRSRLRWLGIEIAKVGNKAIQEIALERRVLGTQEEFLAAQETAGLVRSRTYQIAKAALAQCDMLAKAKKGEVPAVVDSWSCGSMFYNEVSDRIEKEFNRSCKDVRSGKASLVTFRHGQPIPFRARGVRLEVRDDVIEIVKKKKGKKEDEEAEVEVDERSGERLFDLDDGGEEILDDYAEGAVPLDEKRRKLKNQLVLWLSLYDRHQPPIPFLVVGTGGSAWSIARNLAAGYYTLGATSIAERCTGRKRGWYAQISWSEDRVVARIVAGDDGSLWGERDEEAASEIREALRIQAICKEYQTKVRETNKENARREAASEEPLPKPEVPEELKPKPVEPGTKRKISTRSGKTIRDSGEARFRLKGRIADLEPGTRARLHGSWIGPTFGVARFRPIIERPLLAGEDRLVVPGKDAGFSGYITQGTEAGAVILGLHSWMSLVTTGGDAYEWPGHDELAKINGFKAQLKRAQEAGKALADCNRGRGAQRRKHRIFQLSNRWNNYSKTRSEQQASNLVRRAVRSGCYKLVMISMTGIREWAMDKQVRERMPERFRIFIDQWPYYKLQEAIKASCDKHGVECEVLSWTDVVRHCPVCLSERLPTNNPQFVCSDPECGFSRSQDIVEAMNLLIYAAEIGSIPKKLIDVQRFMGKHKRRVAGSLTELYHLKLEDLRKLKAAAEAEAKKATSLARSLGKRAIKADKLAESCGVAIRNVEQGTL